MNKICVVYKAFLAAICCGVLVNGFEHDTFWGEKAPKGCVPCPKNKEGLFDTPICGTNKVAYKNHCYLRLRNCIAKLLRKSFVQPSKKPALCGLRMQMFDTWKTTWP
ncbi:Membrane-bound O-acyltransferase domain-containing 2 [Paramuricea clavata]|uniref:Membrane-bound O-acyltransferase domain-containing 2 n=1 Tax=Paramuricea clavata TaxID=317549 RepID=A0A6S7ILZ7_PARCT|nr:Membrane-bound O-acyltransferase domain-containing 2 [Paramuricea clavata]